jgi:poly(3-hydroxybutyrate) depolymerase
MKHLRASALAVLVLLSASFAEDKAKPEKLTLNFEGRARPYYVFVPKDLGKSAPMLLLLYGSGHNGMSLIDPFKGLVAKEGIIQVAPDASESSQWNQAADGPDFIHAVVEEAKSKYPVDPRRVYLFGHSAGAVYALYLSVIQSEDFAATAIHAGSLLPGDFRIIDVAARKIPIAIWVGTNDPYFSLASVHATRDAFNSR